ncbi:MAG: dihydropteroate synthase [Akkermansiaceae bacterium]|nr:dihydropteroate synthase [Akkermansiaceae bacterium]
MWQLRNRLWHIPPAGGIMGILNVTPDSFSDGGMHHTVDAAVEHARRMLAEGAHIIDVGGESTRPGAAPISPQEEECRTAPVVAALRREFPQALLSIDTRHPTVAAAALRAGADIVNDISGLADPAMRALCAKHPCGIILMHMQGTPQTMQLAPSYTDVVAEVRSFFAERVAMAQQAGIALNRICLDPGIGFGKTTAHNLQLIRHLAELRVHGLPILMALSRKRFMAELLQDPALVKNSSIPTVSMSLLAAEAGACIHRVHDVAPLAQALTLRYYFHHLNP